MNNFLFYIYYYISFIITKTSSSRQSTIVLLNLLQGKKEVCKTIQMNCLAEWKRKTARQFKWIVLPKLHSTAQTIPWKLSDWIKGGQQDNLIVLPFPSCVAKTMFVRQSDCLLSLIHIWRCRRIERCRSRWSPYH